MAEGGTVRSVIRLPSHRRALAALPDAASATVFMALWIAPLAFGGSGVRNAMLVMLVEFILVHATGFLGVAAFAGNASRLRKVGMLAGFGVLYLVFIAAFSSAFDAWWPFLAFGWLLLGKLGIVFGARDAAGLSARDAPQAWAMSALAYIVAVFATLFLPLPRLGLEQAVLEPLQLPGSGVWVEQPHRVIAAGALYFGMMAWVKWRAASVAAPKRT
jgi:hypothetical protein